MNKMNVVKVGGTWYHQTSERNAINIIKNGFVVSDGGNQRFGVGIYFLNHSEGRNGEATLECSVTGEFIDFSSDKLGEEWKKFKNRYFSGDWESMTDKIKQDYTNADGIYFGHMLVVFDIGLESIKTIKKYKAEKLENKNHYKPSILELVTNHILEELDLSPNKEPGSFYDLHIKPFENNSNDSNDYNISSVANDQTDSDYLKSVKPKNLNDKELMKDPISGTFDYSSIQPDLVEELVKTFEGYNYEVKRDGDTIIVTFKQQIGSDLVKKWAELFPDNNFKGIPIDINVDTGI